MSFIRAKIQRLGKSQILSHFYLQRTGFWFDGVYQPGNLTDIPDFKFQHILTIFFNFFYFYFEVWSANMSIIQVSVGTHAYICCLTILTIIINLKYNIYVNTYCYVVRALQNIAHNGLWELWVRAGGTDGMGHTPETVTATRAPTQS